MYKQYVDLYNILEYKKDCYESNKFLHFIELLKIRGFNVNEEPVKVYRLNGMKKEHKKVHYLVDCFSPNNKEFEKLNDYLKLDEEQIEKYQGLILDNNYVENHFTISKLFFNENKAIQKKINKSKDVLIKKLNNLDNKILFLKQCIELLKFNKNDKYFEITTLKKEDEIKNNEFIKKYRILFKDRRVSEDLTFMKKEISLKLIVKMFKNILPHQRDFIKSSRELDKKTNKKITKYMFDYNFIESLKKHKELFDIRNPPKTIKKGYLNYDF